jgi:hypothetical protein
MGPGLSERARLYRPFHVRYCFSKFWQERAITLER